MSKIKHLEESIIKDRKLIQATLSSKDSEKKYKEALSQIEELEERIDKLSIINEKNDYDGKPIKVAQHTSSGSSTAILLVGDSHFEELVTREQTNGLNEYNLAIADARNTRLWQTAVRLVQIQRKGTKIEHMVLGLLGDTITGHIHEEGVENNQLAPAEAVVWSVERYRAGIEYLLKNGQFKSLTIVCKIGNHSRMTEKRRISSEVENSLEYILYHQLAMLFKGDKRVKFVIDKAYHTYCQVYDYTIRFHHGSDIRYGGGVGGITIPAKKAIAQWNKAKRADLDCFGHLHQGIATNDFVANSSAIGWNAYAISIKAEYAPPSQTLFLVHPKYGKTIYCPIYLD